MSDVTDLKAEVLTLRMENKELWGQVERLRNQLHDQQDTAEHNFVRNAREYKRVCDENAKLRELVKAMTPFLCCMPFASCNTLAASVRKRMSELGIEVDG